MSRAFAGLVVALWIASAAPAGAAGSKELHRTVSLAAPGAVWIHTFKGSVEVETWDRSEAEISARVEPDSSCGDDSYQAERVRLTEIEVSSEGSRLAVRSNYDRLKDLPTRRYDSEDWTCSAYPFVHYKLRIPRTARLEIEDHKSDIDVVGLHADARIQTHKGTVNVKGHDGALDLTTHKGDVHVEFARFGQGSRLETYKGDIEVSVPRSAGFDLDARVERGGSLDAPFRLDERQVSRRESVYEQKINGGGPRLELSTRRGSLKITEN